MTFGLAMQSTDAGDWAFQTLGVAHLLTLSCTLAAGVVVPWLAKSSLCRFQQRQLGVTLGWIVAGSYFVWVWLSLGNGSFALRTHLPLHLCWVGNLLLPLAMTNQSRRLSEVVYYWGIVAGIQAALTPTVQVSFPHPEFIRYVLAHNGMAVTLIYAVVVYDFRPTASGITYAFVAGNVLAALAIPVNLLLDANYLFLSHKPEGQTLLNYLGPWPWYVVAGELLALVHFIAAYLPFLATSPEERGTGDVGVHLRPYDRANARTVQNRGTKPATSA